MTFSTKDVSYFWKCWKCTSENGRQRWEFVVPEELNGIVTSDEDWDKPEAMAFLEAMDQAFVFDTSVQPNASDRVFRFLKEEDSTEGSKAFGKDDSPVLEALWKGFDYYQRLQENGGNWSGDYGGPLFLVPGLVIAAYITGNPFNKPTQVLIKRNIWNFQNSDGGWGLHIEGESTMFGTVMQYVSLRLLGMDKDHENMIRAKKWIHDHGGATRIPQWGKFYLSLLNVYDWKGNDALLPEMWLFPKWVPFHPGKFWCHNRMIFLPMSYCYGKKIKAQLTPVLESLREELYTIPYDQINWKKARKDTCETDVFNPSNWWYRRLSAIANGYEKLNSKKLRKKSLEYTLGYIDREDRHTNFIDIGPVSQAINSICVWEAHGEDSDELKQHVNRWGDYLWLAEDGLKMNGYNGSQLWDTCFAGQALLESGMTDAFPEMTTGIYKFVEKNQIDRDPIDYEDYWGDATVGCWPFSTIEHAWAITDCTSEGMKTALLFNSRPEIKKEKEIDIERMKPAIDWLLSMQNNTGGWASYELNRAPGWIEVLNASMLFENIMVEIAYVECTSATMQGLLEFKKHSDYRLSDIETALDKGAQFIRNKQRSDGSWYGSWGVCFTYGMWFSIEGLIGTGAAGFDSDNPDPAIEKACDFLIGKQREDGSWGEGFGACVTHEYVEHENGQIINTAWALLALMKAKYPNREVIEKGIQFICSRQDANGDFPQEGISGVFNGNCGISYTAYRNVFPLWALGRYLRQYKET